MQHSVVAVLALASVAHAGQGSEAAARKSITADYAGLTRAMETSDPAAYAKFITDDFKVVPPKGPVLTRAQILKSLPEQRKNMGAGKWTRTIKSFKLTGARVRVLTEGRMSSQMVQGDHRLHPLEVATATLDDWVLVGKAWKLKVSMLKSVTVKIDGKVIK